MTGHDWNAYQQQCDAFHRQWLRCLTQKESVILYQGLHRFARAQSDDSPGWRRLRQKRWEEKVAIRRKLHEAFAQLDATNAR
ncbi:MAG: hypothetical protein HUU20_09255 [Pirellulales bacterium]|nr:hypothetical protein [Pirellulales bacterium]